MNSAADLRYPIGQYEPVEYSDKLKETWLSDILFFPRQIEYAILNLDEHQLNTSYREGGWTVKQLIHHTADSHLNAYIRFKLGITEENPAIKPYDQAAWAELVDVQEVPVNISITLLHALHTRWYDFIKHFSRQDWDRTLFHPEYNSTFTLWYMLGSYAWHGRHHTAHITELRKRMGW